VSNVELIRGLYDAFTRGDIQSVLGSMDPDCEWREAEGNPYEPSGAPWRGPDEVLQKLFIRLGTEWDGFTVHPKEFHEAGDSVIVEVRYSGTCNETGKSLDAQACHVFRVRGDKVTAFQQYVDTAQLQDVMGAR
jgi:hypothetical protein